MAPNESSAYVPFASFSEWKDSTTVNAHRWNQESEPARKLRGEKQEAFARALEIVKRAAASETGGIEGLYRSENITQTAIELSAWESALRGANPDTRALIEAQFQAYELIVDLAFKERFPINEAFIRRLHEIVCGPQETYEVETDVGKQHHQLPKGTYKQHDNRVKLPDGSFHYYAPAQGTAGEMGRLCGELQTAEFVQAHPILQAAYAHHALVAIHPFSDGNGRVARLVASVFTVQDSSLPILIASDQKLEYFAALESADQGKYQVFVNFILERAIDAARLTVSSIEAALGSQFPEEMETLRRLYESRGGFTIQDVDQAAGRLAQTFADEFQRIVRTHAAAHVLQSSAGVGGGGPAPDLFFPTTNRRPVEGGPHIELRLVARPPAKGDQRRILGIEIPRDGGLDDDILIGAPTFGHPFRARIGEVYPRMTLNVRLRLRVEVERIAAEMVNALRAESKLSLQAKGY